MRELRNELRFFLRRYWPDLLTGVSAVVLYWATYRLTTNPRALLLWSVGITLAVTVAIIYFRVREKDFHFVGLANRSHGQDWFGYGVFEYSRINKAFRITGSDSGFIFSKCLAWGDYRLRFRFKIVSASLGVIVRAVNLANLVMLQIGETGIRPHIRVNGAWTVWEVGDAGLEMANHLSRDQWYECSITCDKALVRICITGDRKTYMDRQWAIPQGTLVFNLGSDEQGNPTIPLPFAITLDYGTVGFRNYRSEEALVREVLVEKIAG